MRVWDSKKVIYRLFFIEQPVIGTTLNLGENVIRTVLSQFYIYANEMD